jgi:hypothetical protein
MWFAPVPDKVWMLHGDQVSALIVDHTGTRGFLPDNTTFLDCSAVLAKDQSLSGLGERR